MGSPLGPVLDNLFTGVHEKCYVICYMMVQVLYTLPMIGRFLFDSVV